MADQEAMKNHGQSEAMRAAMQAFGALMSDRPQMSVTTPVTAIGFEV